MLGVFLEVIEISKLNIGSVHRVYFLEVGFIVGNVKQRVWGIVLIQEWVMKHI